MTAFGLSLRHVLDGSAHHGAPLYFEGSVAVIAFVILALLLVFTPWSAINLTDYYLISKERVDIPALYDPKGRYHGWNWGTIIVYAVGVLVQIPFMSQTLYKGPFVDMLGGADISWLLGLAVTTLLYLPVARRTVVQPDAMIYPERSQIGHSVTIGKDTK